MDTEIAIAEGTRNPSSGFSFSISNLLLMLALVAVSTAWWVDLNRPVIEKYDIPGPVFVSYKLRTSPSSTAGGKINGVKGIDYQGNNVVIYTERGGTVLPGSSLIEFVWGTE